jgi:ABC-type antimicrobial peptide transport system permease subunit
LLNILRRAWRNLVRVPGRTLLLVAVLGAIVGLAVTGLAVGAGAQVGLLDAKRSLGNEVRLVPNFQMARRAALSGQSLPEVQQVPESLADKLASSPHVVASDRTVNGLVTSSDLTPVADESTGASQSLPFGSAFPVELSSGFRAIGNSSPDQSLASNQGQRELLRGRLYTTDEVAVGVAVAVIDESLAEKNGLDVGGTFSLTTRDGARTERFTVIGVTRDVSPPAEEEYSEGPGGARGFRFNLFGGANQILMPYTVVQRLNGQPDVVSSVTFFLDAPENLDLFKSEAARLGLDAEKYMLVSDDPRAEASAAPFQALEGFARVAVIALVLVGALVVILLMSLVTRERKLEIGVLRALGASRAHIATQFIAETLAVCLLAVLVGGLLGGLPSQAVAERLLSREMAATESGPWGRTAVLPGGISIIDTPAGPAGGAEPQIQVRFGWRQIASVFGIGLVLAAAGSATAVYWSMKMEPASILTSRA